MCIAAHIDLDSGLEKAIPGYGDPKVSVLCSKTLVALEISSASALDWYTDRDPVVQRKALLQQRIQALADPFVGILPRIQSSDAHTLGALGRNYAQTEKLTRIKMNSPTWASFRAAFEDPEARIRLEEEIPAATAQFVAMSLTGGFLHGQVIGFSPNLTCIIGGRGSGKSTAFAALRAVAGIRPPEDLERSEAWSDEVNVVYRDEFGAETQVQLTRDGLVNVSDSDEAVPYIAVESLAQGEMARTIEKCGEDPMALLSFLDDLIDLREQRELAEGARKALLQNAGTLLSLAKDLAQLEPTRKVLQAKQAQQDTAKAEKGAEFIELQNRLAGAVQLRRRLLPEFQTLIKDLKASLSTDLLQDLIALADESKALGKPDKASPIPALVGRLSAIIQGAALALDEELKRGTVEINAFVTECQATQQKLSDELRTRADALKAKGVPLDLRSLAELSDEIRKLSVRLTTLKRQQSEWQQANRTRTKLLQEYKEAQGAVSRERQRLAVRLNAQLSQTLLDLTITLSFAEGRLSTEAEEIVKQAMDWRTAAVPKASALVRSMGVPAIVDAMRTGNASAIAAARTSQNQTIVTLSEAQAIVAKLQSTEYGNRLEACRYADLPSLVARRPMRDADGHILKDSSGRPRVVVRDFAQLSLGQQQAIVLGMLLCSDSRLPLLIDQPEDNLDSAFVFQVLVRTLRRIKEHRQVILVTHNANIGVLADSDLVIPLKATADKGIVVSPGSVEQRPTRDLVCEILEGGRAAYLRRGSLYGND